MLASANHTARVLAGQRAFTTLIKPNELYKLAQKAQLPKAPKNAYMLFNESKRSEYTNSDLSMTEVAKKVGQEYRELPVAEKEKYQAQARELRAKYNAEKEKVLARLPEPPQSLASAYNYFTSLKLTKSSVDTNGEKSTLKSAAAEWSNLDTVTKEKFTQEFEALKGKQAQALREYPDKIHPFLGHDELGFIGKVEAAFNKAQAKKEKDQAQAAKAKQNAKITKEKKEKKEKKLKSKADKPPPPKTTASAAIN
ncbi:hypothetical protein NADFUDRAFT_70012 [Nadsonia fulvescens var. elongata DSM 6958]|uniref:HMG box domain-containing protein n=1 Tax=Nadsonia fulvescens var. elongata DSM 6958 TaxID=857566 RepID=A0A1E3PJE2_9ASCO|nr:hypothetical protein NADFUDRAFT_70012 [Nadsonia fulvescens var. elongata DSM 6958]